MSGAHRRAVPRSSMSGTSHAFGAVRPREVGVAEQIHVASIEFPLVGRIQSGTLGDLSASSFRGPCDRSAGNGGGTDQSEVAWRKRSREGRARRPFFSVNTMSDRAKFSVARAADDGRHCSDRAKSRCKSASRWDDAWNLTSGAPRPREAARLRPQHGPSQCTSTGERLCRWRQFMGDGDDIARLTFRSPMYDLPHIEDRGEKSKTC